MNILVNIFRNTYDELWKAIIRPCRDKYSNTELGPEKFRINKKFYKRTDFSITNNRNNKLMCSFWEPYDEEREYPQLPCVIYLHGNSSSRCEAVNILKYMLPLNITVFAFDFAGCGQSDGEYISLGYYEQQDVKCIINFLRKSKKVSCIGLWGRSMGAVTAIMYAQKDHSIAGICLDSPFYSLKILIDEISKEKISLPKFIVNQIIDMIKITVKEKANFNIDDVEPCNFAKQCFVPAFFCHGKNDSFVNIHHSKDLYKIYPGEKKAMSVDGDHNSSRPKKLHEFIALFFYHSLKCKYIKEICDYYKGEKLFFSEWNDKNNTPTGDENKKNASKSYDKLGKMKTVYKKNNVENKKKDTDINCILSNKNKFCKSKKEINNIESHINNININNNINKEKKINSNINEINNRIRNIYIKPNNVYNNKNSRLYTDKNTKDETFSRTDELSFQKNIKNFPNKTIEGVNTSKHANNKSHNNLMIHLPNFDQPKMKYIKDYEGLDILSDRINKKENTDNSLTRSESFGNNLVYKNNNNNDLDVSYKIMPYNDMPITKKKVINLNNNNYYNNNQSENLMLSKMKTIDDKNNRFYNSAYEFTRGNNGVYQNYNNAINYGYNNYNINNNNNQTMTGYFVQNNHEKRFFSEGYEFQSYDDKNYQQEQENYQNYRFSPWTYYPNSPANKGYIYK